MAGVQDVSHRASLAEEATKLHLTGLVRNLEDGCADYLVQGSGDADNDETCLAFSIMPTV